MRRCIARELLKIGALPPEPDGPDSLAHPCVSGVILNLTNTIVAGNALHGISDITNGVTTMNYCLIGSIRQNVINGVGNIFGVNNPGLGPLQNNGGPTMTMALLAGSPAIGQADNAVAPTTDQRGVTRRDVPGELTDIGAYEL